MNYRLCNTFCEETCHTTCVHETSTRQTATKTEIGTHQVYLSLQCSAATESIAEAMRIASLVKPLYSRNIWTSSRWHIFSKNFRAGGFRSSSSCTVLDSAQVEVVEGLIDKKELFLPLAIFCLQANRKIIITTDKLSDRATGLSRP